MLDVAYKGHCQSKKSKNSLNNLALEKEIAIFLVAERLTVHKS